MTDIEIMDVNEVPADAVDVPGFIVDIWIASTVAHEVFNHLVNDVGWLARWRWHRALRKKTALNEEFWYEISYLIDMSNSSGRFHYDTVREMAWFA